MIVDYKAFKVGQMPTNGLLYMLEQIPYVSHINIDLFHIFSFWLKYTILRILIRYGILHN